jgi:hypothetical protein
LLLLRGFLSCRTEIHDLRASSHYEWQEVGRYWGETLVLLVEAAVETPVPDGAAALPQRHNTSLFWLLYGIKKRFWPLIFELATPP